MTNRELDAWIAEHVMGLKVLNVLGLPEAVADKVLIDQSKEKASGIRWDGPARPLPHYTTNPADAMEVLKKCQEVASIALPTGVTTGVMVQDLDKKRRYAIAETLELAICLFAHKLFQKE